MSYSVVWILFLGGCLFLMYFYSGKMRQVKKYQKQQRAAYEENRVKYSHFTSEVFDQTPDEELTHAVLFHLLAKEDKLYEGEEITGTLIDVTKRITDLHYLSSRTFNGRRAWFIALILY